MRRAISVFVAIFCGVVIGALIGSAIETSLPFGDYLWAAGAIAGGLFAYCMVDFDHFKAGAARAARKTKDEFVLNYNTITSWRPYKPYWAAVWALICWVLAIWSTALVIGTPLWYAAFFSDIDFKTAGTVLYVTGVMLVTVDIIASVVTAVVGAILLFLGSTDLLWSQKQETDSDYRARLNGRAKELWELAGHSNPVSLLKSIPGAVKYIAAHVPKWGAVVWIGVRSLANFLGYTIAFVHSQARIICLVDTAIFVVVAHFLGSTLQGNLLAATAGGIFGVINYLVVGVWWLKLVPARAPAG